MKELITRSYEMGVQGFEKGLHSAPAMNAEFMATVPNCAFGDDKGVKLRIKMYKEYSKGWHTANLSQPCN